MKRSTPRIIKTVRSSHHLAQRKPQNPETNIYEKKTVNKTHTITRSSIPNPSRGTRRSNQIMVNRRIDGVRNYTPIKKTVVNYTTTREGNGNMQRTSNRVKNIYGTGEKQRERVNRTPVKNLMTKSMQNSKFFFKEYY